MRQRGNNKHGGGSRVRKRGNFAPGCRGNSGWWGTGGDLGRPQPSQGPFLSQLMDFFTVFTPWDALCLRRLHPDPALLPIPLAPASSTEVCVERPSPSHPWPPALQEVVIGLGQRELHSGSSQTSAGLLFPAANPSPDIWSSLCLTQWKHFMLI